MLFPIDNFMIKQCFKTFVLPYTQVLLSNFCLSFYTNDCLTDLTINKHVY